MRETEKISDTQRTEIGITGLDVCEKERELSERETEAIMIMSEREEIMPLSERERK